METGARHDDVIIQLTATTTATTAETVAVTIFYQYFGTRLANLTRVGYLLSVTCLSHWAVARPPVLDLKPYFYHFRNNEG